MSNETEQSRSSPTLPQGVRSALNAYRKAEFDYGNRLDKASDGPDATAEFRALEAAIAEAMKVSPGPKLFPIMGAPSIPWSLIEPYEFQAEKNHGQSLKRLAERGGLDITEAMAVMMAKPYRDIWRPTLDQFTAFIRAREISQAKHLAELAAISQADTTQAETPHVTTTEECWHYLRGECAFGFSIRAAHKLQRDRCTQCPGSSDTAKK